MTTLLPDYAAFLAGKAPRAQAVGIEPGPMAEALRPDQRDVTGFCLRQGRAALFLDTGLGKSLDELEWCRQAGAASNGYSLILTPLAVAKQFEREAAKFGYEAQRRAMAGRNITWGDKLSTALRKISAEQPIEIKRKRLDGVPIKQLASDYGVHVDTLRKVLKGTYSQRYRDQRKPTDNNAADLFTSVA